MVVFKVIILNPLFNGQKVSVVLKIKFLVHKYLLLNFF